MTCKNCDKKLFLYEKKYCNICNDGSKSILNIYGNIYVTMIKTKFPKKILLITEKINKEEYKDYKHVIVANNASDLRNHFDNIISYINSNKESIILETNNMELAFIIIIAYIINTLKTKPELAITLCKKNYTYFYVSDSNLDILQGYYWTKCLMNKK